MKLSWHSRLSRLLPTVALLLAAAILVAQTRKDVPRRAQYPEWEVRSVVPREVTPARYRQVDEWELQEAARQGWELVAATPYALQNEERGPEGRKQVVTQVYVSYTFRRLREPPASQRP